MDIVYKWILAIQSNIINDKYISIRFSLSCPERLIAGNIKKYTAAYSPINTMFGGFFSLNYKGCYLFLNFKCVPSTSAIHLNTMPNILARVDFFCQIILLFVFILNVDTMQNTDACRRRQFCVLYCVCINDVFSRNLMYFFQHN